MTSDRVRWKAGWHPLSRGVVAEPIVDEMRCEAKRLFNELAGRWDLHEGDCEWTPWWEQHHESVDAVMMGKADATYPEPPVCRCVKAQLIAFLVRLDHFLTSTETMA